MEITGKSSRSFRNFMGSFKKIKPIEDNMHQNNTKMFLKSTENFNKKYTMKIYPKDEEDNNFKIQENDLQGLQLEKEENLNELYKTIDEIELLNFEFEKKYLSKNGFLRDLELSYQIKNKNEKSKLNEIECFKFSVENLNEAINKNLTLIENKMKEEIQEKKKDIEYRINMRLMDAEFRYKIILEEKVREQENMMTSLHSTNLEMIRIKETYEKIRTKNDYFYFTNIDMQKKLNQENEINKILKQNLKKSKIQLKELKNKIYLKNETDENNNEHNDKKFSTIDLSKNTTKNFLTKLTKRNANENNSPHKLDTSDNFNKINTTQSILFNINDKRPNKASIILSNTLKLLQNKFNQIKREYTYNSASNTKLNKRVYDLIKDLKGKNKESHNNYFNIKNDLNGSRSSSLITTTALASSNLNVPISNNKESHIFSCEDRRKFINLIVNDPTILDIVMDKKFPTINNTFRKVNFY